jgi:hypothetical protein
MMRPLARWFLHVKPLWKSVSLGPRPTLMVTRSRYCSLSARNWKPTSSTALTSIRRQSIADEDQCQYPNNCDYRDHDFRSGSRPMAPCVQTREEN